MSCDLTAAVCCLPIVGPCVSTITTTNSAIRLTLLVEEIDPDRLVSQLAYKTDLTAQEQLTLVTIRQRIQKECIPLLKQTRIHSLSAIVGSILTVPVMIAAANLVFGLLAVSGCAWLTSIQFEILDINTQTLKNLNPRL